MLEYHKNEKGLIFKVTGKVDFGEVGKGHSVCNGCGKDMPVCWDVVCSRCDKTFCYDCAKTKLNKWVCKECG